MKDVIEKISSYNLFNYLLPGVLFVVIADKFTSYSFKQENIIIGAFIYYFTGLVISRFGSLAIEPMLKKIKFLKFTGYSNFVIALEKDSKIDMFSEVNNMYRTFCSMFVLLIILMICNYIGNKIAIPNIWQAYILIMLLLIMFLYSYRKQTKYIKKRVEIALDKN